MSLLLYEAAFPAGAAAYDALPTGDTLLHARPPLLGERLEGRFERGGGTAAKAMIAAVTGQPTSWVVPAGTAG